MDHEITRKIFAIVQARLKALAAQRGSTNRTRPRKKKRDGKKQLRTSNKGTRAHAKSINHKKNKYIRCTAQKHSKEPKVPMARKDSKLIIIVSLIAKSNVTKKREKANVKN